MKTRFSLLVVVVAVAVGVAASVAFGAASSSTGNPVKTNKVAADPGVAHLTFNAPGDPTTKTIPGASLTLSVPSTWSKGGLVVARFGAEQIQCLNAGDCEMEIRADGQEMLPDADVPLSLGSNVQRHVSFERYL